MSSESKKVNFFSPGVQIGVAALLVSVGILFFAIPYATGYFDVRKTLAELLQNIIAATRGEWEHCYLVPLAVGIIIYLKRADILSVAPRPFLPGVVLLIFGAAIYYFGILAGIVLVGCFGLQLILMGGILFLFGPSIFLKLLFPLLFLVFAWPMPFLEAPLAFPLRMIMSDSAVNVLNLLGLSTIKSGTAIVSAPVPALNLASGQRFAVDVADPCSGIRSLFALTMIAALYSYFAVKPLWKQIAVFLFAVPLAVLGNLLRILMLTFGTIAFGSEFAIGKDALKDPSWFHMVAGYVVFAVALGGLLGIGALFQMDWPGVFKAFFRGKQREEVVTPKAEKAVTEDTY
jgi:exosortase